MLRCIRSPRLQCLSVKLLFSSRLPSPSASLKHKHKLKLSHNKQLKPKHKLSLRQAVLSVGLAHKANSKARLALVAEKGLSLTQALVVVLVLVKAKARCTVLVVQALTQQALE